MRFFRRTNGYGDKVLDKTVKSKAGDKAKQLADLVGQLKEKEAAEALRFAVSIVEKRRRK